MATQRTDRERNLATEKFEAEVREAEARLSAMQADAEARKAKAEMDEISGLAAAKDRVRKDVTVLKQKMTAEYTSAKREVEQEMRELQTGIERFSEKYSAWDAARERRFNARLDEADAKLRGWKARSDQRRADGAMTASDDLSKLEEKIAIARARAAEAKHEKYSAKAQRAMQDAARHFDEAYDAAARRYGQD